MGCLSTGRDEREVIIELLCVKLPRVIDTSWESFTYLVISIKLLTFAGSLKFSLLTAQKECEVLKLILKYLIPLKCNDTYIINNRFQFSALPAFIMIKPYQDVWDWDIVMNNNKFFISIYCWVPVVHFSLLCFLSFHVYHFFTCSEDNNHSNT